MKEERIKGKGIWKKGEKKREWGQNKQENKQNKGGGLENKERKTQMVGKEEENKKRGFH
jgi:hypothetical protein